MQQFRTSYSELFAIHYGLTFCLFMSTLYDTSLGPRVPTLLPTLSCLKLGMSYSVTDSLAAVLGCRLIQL